MTRDMLAAMVLSAGHGTRLRPLTDWRAKPMVPVGDGPAVGHVVAQLRRAGVERVVVNVHHLPEDLRAWADGARVAISDEQELLGTAGGVARAAPLLGDGDVLVWNGDILSDLDPGLLVDAHRTGGSVATLAVVRRRCGEGNVGLADDGRVVRLRSESFAPESTGADFVGIHVVGATLRRVLPDRGCLVSDVYLPTLRMGARLDAYVVNGSFIDIGTPATYLAANRVWLSARGSASWVAPGAVVSASVDGSIVGSGARVEADAVRSVVWPGAHVREPVADAIVTPHGTVNVDR